MGAIFSQESVLSRSFDEKFIAMFFTMCARAMTYKSSGTFANCRAVNRDRRLLTVRCDRAFEGRIPRAKLPAIERGTHAEETRFLRQTSTFLRMRCGTTSIARAHGDAVSTVPFQRPLDLVGAFSRARQFDKLAFPVGEAPAC
jgi:hypothetical protein